jgi:hypothetical protein
MLGREVDERTDIFSLGVILYEMTTGTRPFDGHDPLDLVVKLGRRALHSATEKAGVPPPLGAVIAKTLEVDVKERYQNAADVDTALAHVERELDPRERDIVVGRTRWRALRLAAIVLSIPLVLAFFGYITLVAYNDVFDRPPEFGSESAAELMMMGLRSLLPIAIWIGAITLVWQAAAFGVRVLRVFGPIDRAAVAVRSSGKRLAVALGLDDPIVLAQAIAACGFIALAAVCWRFWNVILAFTGFISTSEASRFLPLRSDDLHDVWWYQFVLDAIILVFTVSLVRLVQMRARLRVRQGAAGLALVATVLVLAVLMNEVPYRILWQNRVKKIDYSGARCYIIGDHADELLVYCPDTAVPRNRILKKDDDRIHQLGVVESVFTPTTRAKPTP